MPAIIFPDGNKHGQTVPMAIWIGKSYGIHPKDPLLAHCCEALLADYNEQIVGPSAAIQMNVGMGKP